VQWKDGSCDWISLKDLKDCCPVKLAEHKVANNVDDEPAFAWWTTDVLRKRNRIISKIKKRHWRQTHKFGIRMPKSVEEALRLDEQNGNDLWRKAIEKEMSKAGVAFEEVVGFTPDDIRQHKTLVGYKEIKGHMVFDVKMDGRFARKARFVGGGHLTDPPSQLTCSTVVTRESVRIAFMIAGLNDLDVQAADISNAYLNAPCREKVWIVAGPEFGSKEGTAMKVARAWCGLKSSGASWHSMLSQAMSDMGYERCKADFDAWLRPQTKPNGFEYYEHVLIFVDDMLHVSHDCKPTLKTLATTCELKDDSYGTPERCLGANVKKYDLENYVKSAVATVKGILKEDGLKLATGRQADRPHPEKHRPEVDITEELDESLTSRYQQLIGMLRWACELGRIDILYEVSKLSSFNCMPRKGHLDAAYNIFACLDKHENSRLVQDWDWPVVREESFEKQDWTEFYGNVSEEMPPNRPPPRGNDVIISMFTDADHAGNLMTCWFVDIL